MLFPCHNHNLLARKFSLCSSKRITFLNIAVKFAQYKPILSASVRLESPRETRVALGNTPKKHIVSTCEWGKSPGNEIGTNSKHTRGIFSLLLQFSGRKAYRDACSQLGIIPVSFVIEHITREEINIKHHGLGPSGAQAIAFALMRNTTTTTLNLRDCAIGKIRKYCVMMYYWLSQCRDHYVHTQLYPKQRNFKWLAEDALFWRLCHQFCHRASTAHICQNDQNIWLHYQLTRKAWLYGWG